MKRFLFVLSLLFMASVASAQVYPGDKIYFFESGSLAFQSADLSKSNWDYFPNYMRNYFLFSVMDTAMNILLPCAGNYDIFYHSTKDFGATYNLIKADSDNDGSVDDAVLCTRIINGDGTFTYTANFDSYGRYIGVGQFTYNQNYYLDSYLLLNSWSVFPLHVDTLYTYDVYGLDQYTSAAADMYMNDFQLFSDRVDRVSGVVGQAHDTLDYSFCTTGLKWVVCTQDYRNKTSSESYEMRSCGFWVNMTENPEKQFVTVPQCNLGDTLSVSPDVMLNFSLNVLGMDYDIITWDIFQAGTDHIVDYAEGVDYSFLGDSLGVDSGFYLVEATVTDLCGGVAYTADWQVHVEGECGQVSGVVTRSNSTDIWDISNGSISFGGHYSDIVNGSYNLSLEEGCYSVYVQDYDLEGFGAEAGFFESVCVVPWSVRNFNLPYTVANQSLTVCLFSNTTGAVVGRLLSLTSGGVFQSSAFSNASGCVVWGGLHYLTMYYIPSTYNSTVYCEGVFTDMQGDQFRNVSCYDSIVVDALSFSVSDITSGDPVENARVSCGFVYGFTDAFGWVSLTLQEGLDYNCSVSADFYSPYPLVFNNLSASDTEQAVDVRLSPLGAVRDVQFWSWEEVSDLTYIPLEGVEFTLEGVDSDFSGVYDSGTGYFVVPLLDGRYRLSGVRSGYAYVSALSDGGLITIDNDHHYFELFFRESSFGGGGGDMTELNTPDALVAFGWAYLPFILFLLIFVLAGTTIIRSVRDAGLW